MTITNFSLIDFENGNRLDEADLDSLFVGIHTSIEQIIEHSNGTFLIPAGFTGNNEIPAVINNSLFGINGSGDFSLTPLQVIDDAVAAAAVSATNSQASAVAAAASLAATTAVGVSVGVNATSTSTITPVIGANSFTLAQTGKQFLVNQFVTVANSPTKYFNGIITAYDSVTGAITVSAGVVVGSGSSSAWTITASAPAQGEKFDSPVQSFVALGNVTGTTNIDLRTGLVFTMTLTGNTTLTFTMPDLYTSSTSVAVSLKITKAGSQTLTLPAGTDWHDGAAPTLTVGGTDELLLTKDGSADWVGSRARKAIA